MEHVENLHLNIGELIITKGPAVISTVLGSCVCVCLYTENKVACGIIHYSLAHKLANNPDDNDLNYGEFAIPLLVEKFREYIGGQFPIKAKIVGGGDGDSDKKIKNVGIIAHENVAIARKLLKKYGIEIVGEDTGGNLGRKVVLHVPTGRLQSAKIQSAKIEGTKIESKKIEKTKIKTNNVVSMSIAGATKSPRKVLIVDDSKTIRNILKKILTSNENFEIVGEANDPLEAEEILKKINPDVITLDIHMPKMTGVEWLPKLLEKKNIPVVMITSLELKDGNEVFKALELGAVDYIQKPELKNIGEASKKICEIVKNASYARVRKKQVLASRILLRDSRIDFRKLIAIGASTGGTEALKYVLHSFPENIPPTLIVQHIPPVFSKTFAEHVNEICPFEVREAQDGDEVRKNRVLIAPGGKQMKIESNRKGQLIVCINDDAPVNRHRPSVDYLFDSVAKVMGKMAVGVILTGMGNDGARGLLAIRQQGCYTIGQDEESCVVYGMPRAAFELGAVQKVVPLSEVTASIFDHLSR